MESLDAVRLSLTSIERTLQRLRSKQVDSEDVKESIRNFVRAYFKSFRPKYDNTPTLKEVFEKLDGSMQDLLRCIQKRTLLTKYKKILKLLKLTIHEFEIKQFSQASLEKNNTASNPSNKEYKIIETLKRIHLPAAISYEQGLTDLREEKRISWRGTAVEFREALRELLDRLAPDKEVESEPAFKLEPDTKGSTMRQKVVFILKKRRLSEKQVKVTKEAINVIDSFVGGFVRSVYESSSAATHGVVGKDAIWRLKGYLDVVVAELLEIKVEN